MVVRGYCLLKAQIVEAVTKIEAVVRKLPPGLSNRGISSPDQSKCPFLVRGFRLVPALRKGGGTRGHADVFEICAVC